MGRGGGARPQHPVPRPTNSTQPPRPAAPPPHTRPRPHPHPRAQVFNCTPDLLLPAVRSELQRLLSVSPTIMESYIRPGERRFLPRAFFFALSSFFFPVPAAPPSLPLLPSLPRAPPARGELHPAG